jgi:integrase
MHARDASPRQCGHRRVADEPQAIANPPRLLDEVRRCIRYRHYSYRTEQACVEWTRRFVRFCGSRHPREMGGEEVVAFLDHLANDRDVAASTHNQALSTLLFLYRDVLGIELPWLGDIARPRRPRRLPVVLTRDQVHAVLALMEGTRALMARLLYGTGMRLMECLRLRVNNLDLARGKIVVRHGKDGKDHVTTVPRALLPELIALLARGASIVRGRPPPSPA